jgi:hypothetical protein
MSDEEARLRAALIDAAKNLTAAASAYRRHAARHISQGRPDPDGFYSSRAYDFDKAAERARQALLVGGQRDRRE